MVNAPMTQFRYCPRCGQPWSRTGAEPVLHCAACDFLLHFNPTVGVGGFVADAAGRLLWARRSKDPAKGKLGLPGGFVDFGETAETALRREIREEVNLEVGALRFLCSQPNDYPYRGITVAVLDLFFVAPALDTSGLRALDGVESVHWIPLGDLDLDDVAFLSVRRGTGVLREAVSDGRINLGPSAGR
jgi:ADP-ribose pyrophosphatase YjhB (NUDIX family)